MKLHLVIAAAGVAAATSLASPGVASAHGQCGWRWSNYWQQTVYRCWSYGPTYYAPYYRPYYEHYYGRYYHPGYYRPYYGHYGYPYYRPYYGRPRVNVWFGY